MMAATAKEVIAKAASQIGFVASSSKVNPYNTWYYGYTCKGKSPAFCAAFVQWVFAQLKSSALLLGKTAYTPTFLNQFKNKKQNPSAPKPGDLVFFNWKDGGRAWPLPQHVGIVEKVVSSTIIQSIEGNTSSADQSNGGCVQRKQRNVKYIVGYGRPVYAGTAPAEPEKPAAPAEPAETKVDYKVTVTASVLNARKSAGTSAKIAGTYAKGQAVAITAEKKVGSVKWGKAPKGWISLDYTKPYVAPATKSWSVKVTAKAGLNIRKTASTKAKVLGAIAYGKTVKVIADKNGWLTLAGSKGYISKQYTKKV